MDSFEEFHNQLTKPRLSISYEFGISPLYLQYSTPFWLNTINVGTKPPWYLSRICLPISDPTLSLITRKWSSSSSASLSTLGLAVRHAIQKLEYNSSSTGWPDARASSKSFRLFTVFIFVLAITWKIIKILSVLENIMDAHFFPNNLPDVKVARVRINRPRATNEYLLISSSITL